MNNSFVEQDLEIVVATMNRDSLDFLIPMFPFNHFSNFSILIINQTQENKILVSDYPSVRVINSFEKGLSKSRNLGIKNAIGKIVLIADDDVIYLENFDKEIVKAFNSKSNGSVITFNHQRIAVQHPQNKEKEGYSHNKKTIRKVCSVEIAFKLDDIRKNKFCFDDNFGLGSYFEVAEEFLFLRSLIDNDYNVYYNPKVILSHPLISSGEYQGADKIVYARGALNYKLYGYWAYLWLVKYVFFLYRHKYMNSNEWLCKFKMGLSGIYRYKELEKAKKIYKSDGLSNDYVAKN